MRGPVDYEVYGMSRAAWLLLRDRADWEFAVGKGLHPFFCSTYLDAMRTQAADIIAKGC